MTPPNPLHIEMAPDPQSLAQQVVQRFLAVARHTLAVQDCLHVAVSGGRTPRLFFDGLGRDETARGLPWDRIHLFWTDERYVPRDSEDSNYKVVADTLLKRIAIPAENVHGIPTEHPDILAAVRAYEQTLCRVFCLAQDQVPAFDLVLLGMGADGHTASLFPHTYAPFNTEALVCAVFKSGGDINRISLTLPVLRAARQLLVVVSGADKADTLHAVLTQKPDVVHHPIQGLWPVLDKMTWLVDREAAMELDI